jgi:hypothetical protein
MANEQTTSTFNNAFRLKENLNDRLEKLKEARATIDAQIMDVCISILSADRMMDTLAPHINQAPVSDQALSDELDKAVSEINSAAS